MTVKGKGSAGRGKRAGDAARQGDADAQQLRRDPAMRSAVQGVAISAAALTVVVLLAFGFRPALGVGMGGSIATVNLVVFARMTEAFLARRGAAIPWGIIGLLKLTLLLGGVWLIIHNDVVGAGWLALGYASLPLGIILGTLFGPKPIDEIPPSDPPDPDEAPEEEDADGQDVVDGKPRRPGDSPGDR